MRSMTGYGQATYADDRISIYVEIKSLNSKFLDLSLRVPKVFSEKEIEVRNRITETLERGKVQATLEFHRLGQVEIPVAYNRPLFERYYQELKALADAVGTESPDIFKLALQSPEVIINQLEEGMQADEWKLVQKVLNEALAKCIAFRESEGNALAHMLLQYNDSIRENLKRVEEADAARLERIKNRIKGNLAQVISEQELDVNRLEQEMIYYIEKLDISEEKVRLAKHLDYFEEVLRHEAGNGKKLGFISQELGREINTIGSKCNDAGIQRLVVVMKEDLEKIKEQVLNII
jgi:uncharacterized protein (TIGR00255 family)